MIVKIDCTISSHTSHAKAFLNHNLEGNDLM